LDLLGEDGVLDPVRGGVVMETSSTVSGTPAYVQDVDSVEDPDEPEIAAGMAVYDSSGQRVGDVESISVDQVSDKITWIVVRRGHLFARETTIPASLIESVTDRITLNASTEAVKRLELRPDTAPNA